MLAIRLIILRGVYLKLMYYMYYIVCTVYYFFIGGNGSFRLELYLNSSVIVKSSVAVLFY